mmetsp:Transcript_2291/g.4877  ORF Transcript_2291/g.4877 Transcript_2291/m.4877 type:complete len:356 (+) Transcript_2291:50-1117(+)
MLTSAMSPRSGTVVRFDADEHVGDDPDKNRRHNSTSTPIVAAPAPAPAASPRSSFAPLSASTIQFPAIRIRKRAIILWTIVVIISIVATVEHLRTFLIHERALLTQGGRQRRRTRRRQYRKSRLCDEADEPRPWRLMSGWRSLSSCVEYDLSLRKNQLGDNGVRRLMNLLGRREYATRYRRGQLRLLNLERQGITRRGAGYIARWLAVDPLDATNDGDDDGADLVDVERLPTAAYRSIFINLEGNPIGPLGVKQLERAVEKARINGLRVVIVGGGSSSDGSGRDEHVVRLGPIVYARKSVDMPPWRLPVPLVRRLEVHPVLPFLRVVIGFGVGFAVGRASNVVKFPYRVEIVRTS